MAVRGGKALVLAMLISFLLAQGALGVAGTFGRCYCNAYRDCKDERHGAGTCIQAAHWKCIKEFKWLCPKHPVGPDMGAAFAAGGRNLVEADGAGEEIAA